MKQITLLYISFQMAHDLVYCFWQTSRAFSSWVDRAIASKLHKIYGLFTLSLILNGALQLYANHIYINKCNGFPFYISAIYINK